MSRPEAIATVTRVIRDVISRDEAGNVDVTISAKSPDRAATEAGRRINLFLFHATPNLNWRNQAMPNSPGARTGNARSPLALNLHYLLTAYEDDNNEFSGQELLGKVMSRLHDFPVITKTNLEGYQESELDQQVEHVRIMPDPLSIEEMTRLWSTFQTQYRVSAAYQASVVLIESQRPTAMPLPVARRGKQDRGAHIYSGLGPVLSSVEYRGSRLQPLLPSVEVGQSVTVVGTNLIGNNLRVVVRDPKINADSATDSVIARLIPTVEVAGQRLTIPIDPNMWTWPSGQLSLCVESERSASVSPVTGEKETRTIVSNSTSLLIAPKMQTVPGQQQLVSFLEISGAQKILSLSLANTVGKQRKVHLLLDSLLDSNSKPVDLPPIAMLPNEDDLENLMPRFDISHVPPGTYRVRMRVDGVESLLMKRSFDPESNRFDVAFDEQQRIVIQ